MADNSTVSGIQGKAPRLLLSRAETLAALRIGETTLHWLARTKKLNPVKIGARVLFSTAEVEHIARHGCSLSETEKRAAMQRGEVGK